MGRASAAVCGDPGAVCASFGSTGRNAGWLRVVRGVPGNLGIIDQVSAVPFRQHVLGIGYQECPTAYMLLAWDDGMPVGFASYSFLWPQSA
jgi:hypothetical protein